MDITCIIINYSQFKEGKSFLGTSRYASVSAHEGKELGRKDDLESLFFVLIFLFKGNLPWQSLQAEDHERILKIGEKKKNICSKELTKGLPLEFKMQFDYIKSLHF